MKKRLLLLLIITIGVLLVGCKKEDYSNVVITKIEYSYGGGFGTQADTADKIFTFTEGKLVVTNSYDDSTLEMELSKEKYEELVEFIKDRMSVFDEKTKKNTEVMDGGSSYLKVTLDDNTTKEMGGYMVSNKKYVEIKEKIYDITDLDAVKYYIKNIGEK